MSHKCDDCKYEDFSEDECPCDSCTENLAKCFQNNFEPREDEECDVDADADADADAETDMEDRLEQERRDEKNGVYPDKWNDAN